jgi:hypothetical protein
LSKGFLQKNCLGVLSAVNSADLRPQIGGIYFPKKQRSFAFSELKLFLKICFCFQIEQVVFFGKRVVFREVQEGACRHSLIFFFKEAFVL